jgi:phage shock protein PspC (stress-responsive transcriptional regulator)
MRWFLVIAAIMVFPFCVVAYIVAASIMLVARAAYEGVVDACVGVEFERPP